MKFKTVLTGIFLSVFMAGCASIMSGSTQQVTFQSTPEGATVSLGDKPLGKTPLTIQLDKVSDQVLTIEKDGYKTFSTSMDTSIDAWFWGNILIGGLLGSTTDGISGSINEYNPEQYFITLEPVEVAQSDVEFNLTPKEKARKFLFINYKKLKSDLSQDSGEVLDAALDILNVDSSHRSAVATQLKETMFQHNDPAKFVSATIEQHFG